MTLTVTHAKTNSITDWTQAELDAQIALGNFPAGTLLSNIVLPSDWNNNHTITGTLDPSQISVTAGSVLFGSASGGLGEDNAKFFWDDTNNRLGIGTNTPSVELDVVGDIQYTGNLISTSDMRLKTDITQLENSLEKICKVKGYRFRFYNSDTPQFGVMAQELEEVYPELVTTSKDDTKSIHALGLIAPLIEALKELTERVSLLEAKC